MSSLDSPDYSQDYPSEALMLQLKAKTGSILANAAALLESDTLQSEVDRKFITQVAAFIENPTEDLEDIYVYLIKIGEVQGGYNEQGMDAPAAIDAMSAYLRALRGIKHMSFVETHLGNGTADSSNIKESMAIAVDEATNLSKGYKDGSLLNPVNELEERAEGITGPLLVSPRNLLGLAAFQKEFKKSSHG